MPSVGLQPGLLSRTYPLRVVPQQMALRQSTARFRVVPAGRRSGKTEIAKRHTIAQAIMAKGHSDPRYFFGAPTRDQAKAIYWLDLKRMIPRQLMAGPPRESYLTITLWNGCELWVIGMDRPERIEGRPWDGGVLDEYANMRSGAWGENVRPALSDRKGWCWLIGVPEGRNHYYDINQYALHSGDPDWGSYTWPSSAILDPEEVAAARRQLDPLVFEQEYEASFINFTGRAYYPFGDDHCSSKLKYDPSKALNLCFDFNVDPGVCGVVQELRLPGQYERDRNGLQMLDKPLTGSAVVGEVYIPQNSNTEAVCRKIIADWGKHPGSVRCYGDATGGARGSAKTQGSDWDIIKAQLRPVFGDRITFQVPKSNPTERSRINAVNTRLKTTSGEIRLMVDKNKAPNTVRDFEGVRVLEGGSGEIDKAYDKRLTDISDAIGYYIEREFPIIKRVADVESLPLL